MEQLNVNQNYKKVPTDTVNNLHNETKHFFNLYKENDYPTLKNYFKDILEDYKSISMIHFGRNNWLAIFNRKLEKLPNIVLNENEVFISNYIELIQVYNEVIGIVDGKKLEESTQPIKRLNKPVRNTEEKVIMNLKRIYEFQHKCQNFNVTTNLEDIEDMLQEIKNYIQFYDKHNVIDWKEIVKGNIPVEFDYKPTNGIFQLYTDLYKLYLLENNISIEFN